MNFRIFALLFFLLVGCQTTKHHRVTSIEQLDRSWQVEGRIAIVAPAHRNASHVQAHFHWQQEQDAFKGFLQGPFGLKRTVLRGNKENLTIEFSDGDIITSTTPELILTEQGFPNLPVRYFESWILGRPSPGAESNDLVYNEQAHLTEFKQANWHVRIQEYQGHLPKKLQLTTSGVKISFVFSTWTVLPHP